MEDYDTLPNKFFLIGSMRHYTTRALCGRVWYIAQQGLSVGEYDTLSNKVSLWESMILPNKFSLWESMVHWATRFLCGRI